MSTKPRFLLDVEKKLSTPPKKDSEKFEVFQEVFSILIVNIQTFGPVLATVKDGYEKYIRYIHKWYLHTVFKQSCISMFQG